MPYDKDVANRDFPDKDGSTALALPPTQFDEIDIGPLDQSETVIPITVGGRHCFRVRGEQGIRLLSASCPHMGGEVRDIGTRFECPLHGWAFDRSTGKCLNAPGAALSEIETFQRDGRLFARIARRQTIQRRSNRTVADLSIELAAHSSLLIRRGSFTLMTDPWICGPAMLGAWTQYPPPLAKIDDLRPDAIWISHEHSDHFHEPTLKRFDRKTPIYFPDFPNERIPKRLAAMGFTDIHPMPFGERIDIAPNFALTSYEPASLWNDAIVLIEIDGFRLLNLNDAGLNRRIATIAGPVDAVASAFTPGASGYPLTWTHISEAQQDAFLKRSCDGMLQMLREAVKLYGCESLLPYAGHFALWHPLHRRYVRRMRKNTLADVKNALADMAVEVVDLLPGESWNPSTREIRRRWTNRERLYELDRIEKYLDRNFDEELFREHHGDETLTAEAMDQHFLRLNEVPEIVFCEELQVRVVATDLTLRCEIFDRHYEIRGGEIRGGEIRGGEIGGGQISISSDSAGAPNLTMRIPMSVLAKIVREDLSWDESHIGYWCQFSRSPDVFHGGFWRLLQAPYYRRPAGAIPQPVGESISDDTSVSSLIERFGLDAERILRRYGMYCGGCLRATAESLGQAARTHGIDSVQAKRLIDELNSAFTPTRA
jgi:CMP-N-acetylneuraminate monooxygenase